MFWMVRCGVMTIHVMKKARESTILAGGFGEVQTFKIGVMLGFVT